MSTRSPTNPVAPGTITSLERQAKNQNRISVFINDAFAFGVHQDVLLQHMLYVGLELDLPTIEELQYADQLVRAKTAAIHFLSYRARTEYEIRDKLRQKGFELSIIDIVIRRLHELSYIDDNSFVMNYVRDRLNRKGHGPVRLKSDLRKLGISQEQVDSALAEVTDTASIVDKAHEQARKRIKRLHKEKDPFKKRRKLYDFLLRRGHTVDTVKEVLERIEQEQQL